MSRRCDSRRLSSLLASGEGGLKALYVRSHRLQALNDLLRGALGDPLGPHVQLCNLRGDTAVVAADSPAWLTQLRFQAPVILHILRSQADTEGLRKVRFKVQPPDSDPMPAHPPRRARLSPGGAEALNSAADHLESPTLAEALRRLARRAEEGR